MGFFGLMFDPFKWCFIWSSDSQQNKENLPNSGLCRASIPQNKIKRKLKEREEFKWSFIWSPKTILISKLKIFFLFTLLDFFIVYFLYHWYIFMILDYFPYLCFHLKFYLWCFGNIPSDLLQGIWIYLTDGSSCPICLLERFNVNKFSVCHCCKDLIVFGFLTFKWQKNLINIWILTNTWILIDPQILFDTRHLKLVLRVYYQNIVNERNINELSK